jgi:hypothetical protein
VYEEGVGVSNITSRKYYWYLRSSGIAALVSAVMTFTGCALGARSPVVESFDQALVSFAGKGPVGLSSSDSFQEANLALSGFSARSSALLSFFEKRGVPAAFEVEDVILQDPILYLFYPFEREYFIVEPQEEDLRIRGPVHMPDETLGRVRAVTRHEHGEARLAILEYEDEEGDDRSQKKLLRQSSARRQKFVTKEPQKVFDPEQSARTARLRGVVSRFATGLDEGKAGEDLVHRVQWSGETPRLIAAWYTEDPTNGSRLARIEGVSTETPLPIGFELRVPGYLVKNRKHMSKEAMESIQGILLVENPGLSQAGSQESFRHQENIP